MGSDIEWRDIDGYIGLYQVCADGRVRSKDRFVITINGYSSFRLGVLLKPRQQKNGYYSVELSKNGLVKNHYVHRLVAAAFIANEQSKSEINHINGIKADNNISNLEWSTHLENMQHANITGLIKKIDRLFSWSVCLKNVESGIVFSSIKDAADFYGRNYETLKSQLRRGKCDLPLHRC